MPVFPSVKLAAPPPSSSERLAVIIEEVRARLSAICAEMPAPLFIEMVERIARVQLRFERLPFRAGHKWE